MSDGSGVSSIGLEAVESAAIVQIKDNLPAQLQRQAFAWDQHDKTLAERLGQPWRKTILEEPVSYYPGSRLGVLDMPWDSFPSIATMADSAVASPESALFDQSTDVYMPQLYIEGVLRSDAYLKEDKVERVFQEGVLNRRAKRTIEAIVSAIAIDRTLGASTLPLGTPEVSMTNAFTLDGSTPEDASQARIFCIIDVRYSVDVYATRMDATQSLPAALAQSFLGPMNT